MLPLFGDLSDFDASTGLRRNAKDQIQTDPDFKFPVIAHILIRGKSTKYSAAVPGIWEECMLCVESHETLRS